MPGMAMFPDGKGVPPLIACKRSGRETSRENLHASHAMKHFVLCGLLFVSNAVMGLAMASDELVRKELTPTGKLRVAIAIGPTPGAGNVSIEGGKPRGIAVDLGSELAGKLGVPMEFVHYENSGALTDAAASGAWDVAFVPVDDERRKKIDFGAAHLVLQSTYLVAPNSPIKTLDDADRAGVRIVGVENTATARAAARSLKNTTISHVKDAATLFELLRTGQADAIAQSRELLVQLSAKLPGSRVLDGAYLNSYIAIAVPKGKPAALAYVSEFLEGAKAAGSVRRALDAIGMQSSVVAPAGVKP